jgi:NAD(P)-dependent dehydrogenase (short-subunit alcohol dehydrogenase family)
MRLTGKVALVTGAARPRGIGRGMVQALADEGAAVAVNDIAATQPEGGEFVDELRAKGVRAGFFPADVSNRDEVDALVAAVQAELGGLDIVCSNAGVADWKTVIDTDEATFDRIVAVNLTGAFNVGQAAARADGSSSPRLSMRRWAFRRCRSTVRPNRRCGHCASRWPSSSPRTGSGSITSARAGCCRS